nr:MAG TPA: hypothetical protein [Caudoviricetes sp.]
MDNPQPSILDKFYLTYKMKVHRLSRKRVGIINFEEQDNHLLGD